MLPVKTIAKNLGKTLSKNSPTILTAAAATGVVATAILAVKATPKALVAIDNALYDRYLEVPRDINFSDWLKQDKEGYDINTRLAMFTKPELIQLTWRYYVPAIATGVTSIACMVGSNHINLQRQAALASVYAITEKTLKEYQAKTVETLGPKKEQKMRDEISAEKAQDNPRKAKDVFLTGHGNTLFCDGLSGNLFRSDVESVRKTINDLNQKILENGDFISLNDLYYELGLPMGDLGNNIGWQGYTTGVIKVEYSSTIKFNEPCMVLNYPIGPRFI